ncbi:biogenesis of lysosome-related organelles complex 1 subunit 2-like [Dysidea avara]|uniref:biogenesis of lysosome-related organelles complex 1 subunit 2-like n=1 Tax=Dysidea avara TaxID=196820 RepID=UPI003320A623
MAAEEDGGTESVDLKDLCKEMFDKITQYLNGELTATSEEYKLLQQLNQITLAKYTDMCAIAHRLNEVSSRVNDNYKSLQPYLEQIDQLEASVSTLEQTAYRLDAYSKKLEAKFKAIERR